MCSFNIGRRSVSKSFATGESREIGRYDFDWSAGFPGFKSGIMRPTFHISGILSSLRQILNKHVKYLMQLEPRCFSMMGAKPSGPRAFELLVVLMAS